MTRALLILLTLCLAAPAYAQEPPPAPETALEAAPPETPPIVLQPPPVTYRSLLYSREQTARVGAAIAHYRQNLSQRTLTGAVQQAVRKNTITTINHPQFFLSSIVYRSPSDWVVWLHDRKFASDTPQEGELSIKTVTKDLAIFTWKPMLFSLYERRYTAPKPGVRLDKIDQTITVTLHPNQTFSAYTLAIQEGYLPPLFVEVLSTPVEEDGSLPTLPTLSIPAAPIAGAPLPETPTIVMPATQAR